MAGWFFCALCGFSYVGFILFCQFSQEKGTFLVGKFCKPWEIGEFLSMSTCPHLLPLCFWKQPWYLCLQVLHWGFGSKASLSPMTAVHKWGEAIARTARQQDKLHAGCEKQMHLGNVLFGDRKIMPQGKLGILLYGKQNYLLLVLLPWIEIKTQTISTALIMCKLLPVKAGKKFFRVKIVNNKIH